MKCTSLEGTCDPRCRHHRHHNSRPTLWVQTAYHLGLRDSSRSCKVLYVHAVFARAIPGGMVYGQCHAAHLDPTRRLATLHRAHDSARAGAQVGANVVAASTRVTREYSRPWPKPRQVADHFTRARGGPFRLKKAPSQKYGNHHDCRVLHVGGIISLSVRRVALNARGTDLAWAADKRYLGDHACEYKCRGAPPVAIGLVMPIFGMKSPSWPQLTISCVDPFIVS